MKKFSKFLLVAMMGFGIVGCSCSNDECKCPIDNQNTTEEKYSTINNGYRDLYKQTTTSVVMIKIQHKETGEYKAGGSGVVFFQEGESAYILTNAHVIKSYYENDTDKTHYMEVYFSDENGNMSGESERPKVIYKDYEEDVGVLEINKSDKYKVATIGDSSKVEKGDFVYTIGSPDQKFNHTTSGTISTVNSPTPLDFDNNAVETMVYALLFDAPINNGNSGGGLFNSKGELIGITTFKIDKAEMKNTYAALPINFFVKVAKALMVGGAKSVYVRPTLDLTLGSVNEMGKYRETQNIADGVKTGVYIYDSFELNVAKNLLVGKIITAINDVKIISNTDLQVEILKYNVGEEVTLKLIDKYGLSEEEITLKLHA